MGVGTTTPQGLLDINSGSGGLDASALFVRSDPGVFGRGGIIHHQSATYAWQELAQTTGSATDGYLAFHYVNRTAPGTKVTSNVLALRANGNVGIGTTTPTSRLEIAAQDGLAITGFQPFLTLRDGSAGNARGVIQNVSGGLNLLTNSYLGGTNPTAFIQLNNSGNVGIGVTNPTLARLHVDGGGGTAVYGQSAGSYGLLGFSTLGTGVGGHGTSSYGVAAYSENNDGLVAQTNHPDHAAIVAQNLYSTGYALLGNQHAAIEVFQSSNPSDYGILVHGSNNVFGGLTVNVFTVNDQAHIHDLYVSGTKNFQIDHPLDPGNKTLSHSCIESNERLLMYSGTVVTNADGDAAIQLPSYFESLNINYRYQLTIVGEEFAQSRVSREISNNQFSIKTDKPSIKVCWQVTGDRNDAYSKAHPYVVEEEKKPEDRGKYLAPELFGQSEEMRIGYRPPPAHQQTDHASPLFPANKEK